jgi:hypothetical protein
MTTTVTIRSSMQALIDAAEKYCKYIETVEHKQDPEKTYSLSFLGITKISDVDITFNYKERRYYCCEPDQSDEWVTYDRFLELGFISQEVYDFLTQDNLN